MTGTSPPINVFSRLRSIPDDEMRGPLPYIQSATATICISILFGAIAAFLIHTAFGVAPAWFAAIIVLLVFAALTALKKMEGASVTVAERTSYVSAEHEAHTLLQALFERTPALVGVVQLENSDLGHIYDNPAASQFFGALPGRTQGRLSSELDSTPEITALWVSKCNESNARGTPVRFDFQTDTPKGNRWFTVTVSPLHDAPSPLLRFGYIGEDITDVKRMESQSSEINERLSIYNNTPLSLAYFDRNCTCVRINEVMASLLGRTPNDLQRRSLREIFSTNVDGLESIFKSVVETRVPVLNFEIIDGTPEWPGATHRWKFNFYPNVSTTGEILGVNVIGHDVTEHRRLVDEHAAYRSILGSLVADTPLHETLDTLAASVELIFPTSVCYIIQSHDRGETIQPLSRSCVLTPLFTTLPSSAISDFFSDVTKRGSEKLLSDTSQVPQTPLVERLAHAGIRSCWARPIILSDSTVWGACVLNHPTISLNPAPADREHLDILLGLASTVIEKKRSTEQLASARDRLEFAERAGEIGVFDWNTQTGDVIWTSQMEELFGLSPNSFEGTFDAWALRIHKEDLEGIKRDINALTATRQKSFSCEHRFVHASGAIRWMHVQGSFTYDDQGETARLVGIGRDVTERRKVQDESRISQERLALALESGRLGFWDWDLPSGHVFYGGAWSTMLGYSSEYMKQHFSTWEQLVHPDDMPRVQNRLKSHFSKEIPEYMSEYRLKRKDGSWRWSLARGRVVEWDTNGAPIRMTGILGDITEQHEIREALKLAAQKKDEFLATLAHELRNPLAPLRTGLQILKSNPAREHAVQARDMMERQLMHMVRLIDDLLDVSRITRGLMELRKERIALRGLIENAVEASRPTINAGEHTLSILLHDQDQVVYGDPTRLSQIISNLLANAAKYTANNGHITLEERTENGSLVIQVRDDGLGIPSDMLDNVFEMFGQINRNLHRTQGGLGIGLALVRKLVELHGGEIHAESAGLGKGSTFTVRLPILSDEAPHASRNENEEKRPIKGPMKEILVVDDNIDGAASLAMYLEIMGHRVTIAHSGPEAMDIVRKSMPHVIFLDIGLPGMSGYEVARSIREMPHGKEPLVVAVTGWGTEEDKRKSSEAGCNVHLTKPIDLSETDRLLI